MATQNRRLCKEIEHLAKANLGFFRDVQVDERNVNEIRGLLLPTAAPWHAAAFKVRIVVPANYPFAPPQVHFDTLIRHPNVEASGKMCFPLITSEAWKPATSLEQVLRALRERIDAPDLDTAVRQDVADDMRADPAAFAAAVQADLRAAEPRPL